MEYAWELEKIRNSLYPPLEVSRLLDAFQDQNQDLVWVTELHQADQY